jgi:hypothetical protein
MPEKLTTDAVAMLVGRSAIDTDQLDDAALGRAYKLMIQAHQGGLQVDFITGMISLPTAIRAQDDLKPLIEAAEQRGRDQAREQSARLCDHYGHNWSGAPALAFFECAEQIRNETPKYNRTSNQPSMQVSTSMYYMRDNHTFKRLTPDVETALGEIAAELDAGHTSGMLASKCVGAPAGIHARHDDREGFLRNAREWLVRALGRHHTGPLSDAESKV